MRTFIAAFLTCLTLACTQSEPILRDKLDVSGPSYRLNVSSIGFADDYHASKRPPHVEFLSDVTPAQAVRNWAGARLVAAGRGNTLEVNIRDASILRRDVAKRKTGIEGAFTTEQTEEYTGTLEVEIKLYGAQGSLPLAHLDVTAHQFMTLPGNAAPIDREKLAHNMTAALMKSLARQLDENLHRYFGNYLL